LFSYQSLPLIRCGGGYPPSALDYVVKNGIPETSGYPPYKQANGACQRAQYPGTYFLPKHGSMKFKGDEAIMLQMLIKYGPMIVLLSKCKLDEAFLCFKAS
jgi:Papain family cysteine protease